MTFLAVFNRYLMFFDINSQYLVGFNQYFVKMNQYSLIFIKYINQIQLIFEGYSKEPSNRDGVLTGGLCPPDPPNKSASGLHGNMDLGWEASHFQGGRRPTYLGVLGGGAPHLIPHHDSQVPQSMYTVGSALFQLRTYQVSKIDSCCKFKQITACSCLSVPQPIFCCQGLSQSHGHAITLSILLTFWNPRVPMQ